VGRITIDGVEHRLRVDHDLCMGNRVCQAHLPQLFTVDDDTNLASVTEGVIDAGLADEVREAVAECPQDAIILEPVD